MPAARGLKRTASKASASTASAAPKTKKKRGAIQLEIPSIPKRRGRVFACGQGDVGQLGLGEDVMETNKFKYVSALGDKIVDVCAGGMHTIALDSDGKVWTFGCNDEGALGRITTNETEEGTPSIVALPEPAVSIAAGDSHSVALLHNGDVYYWGAFRDSHGSMGLIVSGREGKPSTKPVKVDIGEPAVAVASGGDHLVILSSTGVVYTMGCGEQGQLGRVSQRSASRNARQGFSTLLVPTKVSYKLYAMRVWAGYHATFALDATTQGMRAWGLNNYSQLGITGEKNKTALFAPMECDSFNRDSTSWAQVSCGQHHTLCIDTDGRAYSIGRCEYGRLGLGEKSGDAETLEPIPKLQGKKCVSISAGTSNSFAVTDTGEIYAWGMGSEGQLGTGSSSDAAEPTACVCAGVDAQTALVVSAGGQHTVLLLENPSPRKVASPVPDKETSEQTEEQPEPERKEAKKTERKPRGVKRRNQEQEEEVSSTSSAQAIVSDEAPQKVNGDEKKETPMEVDENDAKKENKDDKIEEKPEPMEDKIETDTSSQDTSSSEKQETKTNDVEMKEDKTEINGTPEVCQAKTVEKVLSSDKNLATA